MRILIIFLTSLTLLDCSSRPVIIDKPVSFPSERVALTKTYMNQRYGIVSDSIVINPKMIVVHWTAIPIFEKSFAEFNKIALDSSRADIMKSGAVNVSIHFLVDKDGSIYRLMPEMWMARHVIGLNHVSIGIENVGGARDRDDLTHDQLKANEYIVRYLKVKYPSIEYLIGHYEYTLFDHHPLWKERDSTYRTEKTDPGVRFMTLIRERVSDLGLKGR
jgi:N-acetyl-anhydromuramyl-L-alanine amidase AmpD